MAPYTVLKDTTDPDFPHGTEKGYFRGCHAECCHQAHYLAGKRRRYAEQKGQPATVPAEPVREHVRRLLELPNVHATTVDAAAGVGKSVTWRLLNETRERMRRVTAAKLLAVTPEQVCGHTFRVKPDRAIQLCRSLQAQGWSLAWQARRLGMNTDSKCPEFIHKPGQGAENILRVVEQRVEAMAAEVGDRQGPSERSKLLARRLGWYPLACYDDNGVLIPRAVPDHPWSVADEKAALHLDVVRALVNLEFITRIAARTGVHEKQIDRIRQRVGLGFEKCVAGARLTEEDRNTLRPECQQQHAHLRAILDAYDYDNLDPVLAAFRANALPPIGHHIPHDHPGYLAWLEEYVGMARAAHAVIAQLLPWLTAAMRSREHARAGLTRFDYQSAA